jgi:hypothetical protein
MRAARAPLREFHVRETEAVEGLVVLDVGLAGLARVALRVAQRREDGLRAQIGAVGDAREQRLRAVREEHRREALERRRLEREGLVVLAHGGRVALRRELRVALVLEPRARGERPRVVAGPAAVVAVVAVVVARVVEVVAVRGVVL